MFKAQAHHYIIPRAYEDLRCGPNPVILHKEEVLHDRHQGSELRYNDSTAWWHKAMSRVIGLRIVIL